MILHPPPLSEFGSIRENSWLIPSPLHKTPPAPTLPILPQFHSLCVLCDLCGYKSIMQNKPNFQNAKTTATSYFKKSYINIPLRPTRKNKPKQTQSWRSGKKHLPTVFGAINILSRNVGPVLPDPKEARLWTYRKT